jgi:hypothetical protein
MFRVAITLLALLAVTEAYRVRTWAAWTNNNGTFTCTPGAGTTFDQLYADASCQAVPSTISGQIPIGGTANLATVTFATITFGTSTTLVRSSFLLPLRDGISLFLFFCSTTPLVSARLAVLPLTRL